MWMTTSCNTRNLQNDMRWLIVTCTLLACISVSAMQKAALSRAILALWHRSQANFVGGFAMGGLSRELMIMLATFQKFSSWTTGTIAPLYWCAIGSKERVTFAIPVCRGIDMASPQPISTTWMAMCMPTHLRFPCTVNKYFSPTIHIDLDGK